VVIEHRIRALQRRAGPPCKHDHAFPCSRIKLSMCCVRATFALECSPYARVSARTGAWRLCNLSRLLTFACTTGMTEQDSMFCIRLLFLPARNDQHNDPSLPETGRKESTARFGFRQRSYFNKTDHTASDCVFSRARMANFNFFKDTP
jgi:hypothetical protein